MHEPKSRTLVGTLGIVTWMIAWVVLVVEVADGIGEWHVLLQMLFYLIAGLGWIIPLRPVLRWMETGSFKA